MATIQELLDQASTVKNETLAARNTAVRVGTLFEDIINSFEALKEDKSPSGLETTAQTLVGAINELKEIVDDKQNSSDNNLLTVEKTVVGAINEILADLSDYQTKTDADLTTTAQTIVGAINELNTALATKQAALTFDGIPTAGSTNPVTSEGVKQYVDNSVSGKQDKQDNTLTTTDKTVVGAINELNTALATKQDELTFDSTPTAGSTNPVTSGGVKTYVDNKVSSLYKPKGSVAFASLPSSDMEAGDVYNVTDDFVTDTRFKEGAGNTYTAGTNVVWTADGYWDCLSGSVDLTSYQEKEDSTLNTTDKTVVGAINELHTEQDTKQDKTDNTLDTTDKTVAGAINEVFADKVDRSKFAHVWQSKLNTTQAQDDANYYSKILTLPRNGMLVANVMLREGTGAGHSDTVYFKVDSYNDVTTLRNKEFATTFYGSAESVSRSRALFYKNETHGYPYNTTISFQILFCSCGLDEIVWHDTQESQPFGNTLKKCSTISYNPPDPIVDGVTITITNADKTAGFKDIDLVANQDFNIVGADGLPEGFYFNATATDGEYYDQDKMYRFSVDNQVTDFVVMANLLDLFALSDVLNPNDILTAVPPISPETEWRLNVTKSSLISSDGSLDIMNVGGISDITINKSRSLLRCSYLLKPESEPYPDKFLEILRVKAKNVPQTFTLLISKPTVFQMGMLSIIQVSQGVDGSGNPVWHFKRLAGFSNNVYCRYTTIGDNTDVTLYISKENTTETHKVCITLLDGLLDVDNTNTVFGSLIEHDRVSMINSTAEIYFETTIDMDDVNGLNNTLDAFSSSISSKQSQQDSSLNTETKTIVGAINEIQSTKYKYVGLSNGLETDFIEGLAIKHLDLDDTYYNQIGTVFDFPMGWSMRTVGGPGHDPANGVIDIEMLLFVHGYSAGYTTQLCYARTGTTSIVNNKKSWYTRSKHFQSDEWDAWEEIGGGSGDLSLYQKITDNTLQTTSKTVPGAINELLEKHNSANVEFFPYADCSRSELLQQFSQAGQLLAWLFIPTLEIGINSLKFICTGQAGGTLDFAIYRYSGDYTNLNTTVPVTFVGATTNYTVIQGMNKVILSGTATLDPQYMYFAVGIQRSTTNPTLVGRSTNLPSPSDSMVPFVVYGTLDVEPSALTDFRNNSQLVNAQFPQGQYIEPWFILS